MKIQNLVKLTYNVPFKQKKKIIKNYKGASKVNILYTLILCFQKYNDVPS